MPLHVQLFGRLKLEFDGQGIGDFDSRKAQELLSYLLVHRGQAHPREQLAEILWGDCNSAQQCRSYLRKALWQIQKAIDPYQLQAGTTLLLADADSIQLNPGAPLWCDVSVLEDAYTQVRRSAGRDLDEEQQKAVRAAVEVYRGGFLEGWYENWCIYERERLHQVFVILVDKLMGWCEARGSWEEGVIYGGLLLRHEPAHERTHQRLMRLHHQMRDRTSALRQYARCVRALEQELGVEPSKRTVTLYERIRDGSNAPGRADRLPGAGGSLETMLERLKQIEGMLAAAQLEICENIQAIEQYLAAQS